MSDECPFCGSLAPHVHADQDTWHVHVRCGKCGAQGPKGRTEPEAIMWWNKRAKSDHGSGGEGDE